MKKIVLLTALLLSISFLLCGCLPDIMFIPNNDSIGEPKKFENDGFAITLTDKFKEQTSEMGFDAYFVTDFCGVVVLREEFTLEEGLAEMSLEKYITNVTPIFCIFITNIHLAGVLSFFAQKSHLSHFY